MSIQMPVPHLGADTMEQRVARRRMSFAEYERLPEKPRHEWVDGVALIMDAAFRKHNRFVGRLTAVLIDALPDLDVLPENSFRMTLSLRVPDITVADPNSNGEKWLVDPPILIVEVLSPSTWREDLERKDKEYAQAGVDYYWTVDTEVQMITMRVNVGKRWRVEQIVDKSNPDADIKLGHYGTIPIRLGALFR